LMHDSMRTLSQRKKRDNYVGLKRPSYSDLAQWFHGHRSFGHPWLHARSSYRRVISLSSLNTTL